MTVPLGSRDRRRSPESVGCWLFRKIFLVCQSLFNPNKAGAEGFEPSNTGFKDLCLTTWRRPNSSAIHSRRWYKNTPQIFQPRYRPSYPDCPVLFQPGSSIHCFFVPVKTAEECRATPGKQGLSS